MTTRIRRWLAVVAVAGLVAGRLGAAPSGVTLATSANPSLLGQPVKMTATIAPANATGKVAFYDGTTILGSGTVSNGQAAFTTIMLPSGSRPLHAYYSGDTHYASSLSATLVQTVRSVPSNGFAPAVTYPLGGYPTSVAVADFNSDGKADLAATGTIGGGVSVLLGNGDGTFKAAVTYAAGVEPASVAVGDFNGDGIPDLAVANSASGNVSVLLGKGDGTFEAAVNYVTGPESSFVAVGDFNDDGKADLVVANTGTGGAGSISVLLGNGDGTFKAAANYLGVCAAGYINICQRPSVIAIADFNGDGKADLAVSYTNTVSVLFGNGDGTFQPAVDVVSGVSSAYLAVGDFNGDGKADIAVLISNSVLDVLLGKGDGTFQSAVSYSSGADTYTSSTSIVVADFNGDGKPDLMVGTTSDSGSFVDVLLSNGDGTFQSGLRYAVGFFTPAAVGDFTGDGRTDLAGYVTGGVGLLLAGTGLPTTTTLTSSPNPSVYGQSLTLTADVSPPAAAGSVAFFNGASTAPVSGGRAVLVVDSLLVGTYSLTAVYTGDLTYGPSTSPVLTQTVSPVPETVTLTSSANPSPYGQNVTLTATLSPQSPTGYFSVSGTVTFMDGTTSVGIRNLAGGQASLSIATLSVGTHSLTAIYSGDAYHAAGTSPVLTQTVAQGAATTPTTVLTSSANPSIFGQSVALTATVSPTGSGRVTFYDGVTVLGTRSLVNGQATLTTSLLASGKRALRAYYAGSASYTASTSTTITLTVDTVPANGFQLVTNSGTATSPTSIAVGDFNEDGKADVAVTGNAGNVIVLLGKGDGTFQPAISLPLGANPFSVVVGDFNGDGHTDLAVSNGSNVSVLLGNGNGTFQAAVNYPVGDYPYSVGVADLNGDGIEDLVVLTQGGVLVLLGNAGGTFQTAMDVSSITGDAFVIGDFNGDGVPDLAVVRAAGLCTFIGACVGQLVGGGVSVLLGYGDGTFQPPVNYPSVSGDSIAVADFLGNGRTDLAVAFTYPGTPVSGSASWLLGSGDGTFLPPSSVPVPGVGAGSILTGDFNGDGIADLAVVSNAGNTGNLVVLLGDGQGNFPTMFEYPAGGYGVAAVADFNGDGRADVANAVTNSVNVLLAVTTANPNPAIKANGVVNAASFAPAPLVPGSLATVSGTFPVTGLSLQFANGLNAPVPLLYVSPTQVNFQVPWELAAPSQTTITAIANGRSSIPQNVTIASFAPGIFPGAVLDSNYRPVDSTNPATAGSSVVQIYCTGLGPVTDQPADGAPAPSIPLSTTPYTPVVSIGGAPAQVLFSGLAPGAVGLYQVNALVPAGSPKGPAVPVEIQGGSNIVTIAVQ